METKQLTPTERLAIYKEAYRVMEIMFFPYGLCYAIGMSQGQDYPFSLHKYNFIELLKHEPNHYHSLDYWFNPNDRKTRLDILQQCINEVTQLIENGGE